MEHETPKELVVPATHGDGEPPKTIDARYVKDIMHYFDNLEKTAAFWERGSPDLPACGVAQGGA